MTRLRQLEKRRRELLRQCEAQREELAGRLAQLNPGTVLQGSALSHLRHPLAWAAALVGVLLLRRTREVLTFITWARLAVTLAGRVASILRLLTQPRADSPGR